MGRAAKKRAASRRGSMERTESISPMKAAATKTEEASTPTEAPPEGEKTEEEPSTPRMGRLAPEATPLVTTPETPPYFSPAARAFSASRARPPAPPGTSPLLPLCGGPAVPGSAESLGLKGESPRERPRRASAPHLQLGGMSMSPSFRNSDQVRRVGYGPWRMCALPR